MVDRYVVSLEFRARKQRLHDVKFDKFGALWLLDESVLYLLLTEPFGSPRGSHPVAPEKKIRPQTNASLCSPHETLLQTKPFLPNIQLSSCILLSFYITKSTFYRALFGRLDPLIRDQLLTLHSMQCRGGNRAQ